MVLLELVQQALHGVQPFFPIAARPLDPAIDLVQRTGIDGENVVAPFLRRSTTPLASSTRMCFDTAFKDIRKGSATSVTRASLRESRSIIARRVGSANAANTASRRAVREAASFRASISIMAICPFVLDSDNILPEG